jgi:hypothetical protein
MNFFPYNYVCPPYGKSKNKVINFLQSLIFLKQNALVKGILKVLILFSAYMLILGKWGESRFRREIAQSFITFLKKYA